MKALLLILLCPFAWGTFTGVQDPSTAGNTGAACYPVAVGGTCPLVLNSTGANHLLYIVTIGAAGTTNGVTTPTNGQGCTKWIMVPNFYVGSTGAIYFQWYCPKSLASTTSITITLTNSTGSSAVLAVAWEQSYTGTYATLDNYCNSSSASTASPVPGCTIPSITGTNDLLLYYIAPDGGPTVTAINGSGWSNTINGGVGFPIKANTTTLTAPTATTSSSPSAFNSNAVAFTDSSTHVIGCIGDSDTFTLNTSPQTGPCITLVSLLTAAWKFPWTHVPFGIIGSASSDWVSGSTNMTVATQTFTDSGVSIVIVTLGGNDAADATQRTSSDFQTNMQSLTGALEASGFNKIVLNYEPYILGGTGFTNGTVNPLLVQYQGTYPAMHAADPNRVFIGDVTAYVYFQANTGEFQGDGVHLNNTGAGHLGTFWFNALIGLDLPRRGMTGVGK